MEKILTTLRTYTTAKDSHKRKNRFCVTCGNVDTTEALFNIGEGVTIIEKYCDICAKQVR